jgi:uncharacterized protein (DUF302 family)
MSHITSTAFANSVKLNLPYQEALEKVSQALKAEGFGILTQIDMQATLKQKLNADLPNYMILGVCHAPFAKRALDVDMNVGLLLPCSVVVYAEDSGTVVAILDPLKAISLAGNPALQVVAAEAKEKLDRALAALEA